MLLRRILAAIQALSLILGETYRSWGAGRHIVFVVDDYWMGALLLLGAWMMRRDSFRNRALFAAGWGVCAGMLYGSFFGKLVEPSSSNPGNFDMGLLTGLLGLAFFVALAGMIATITLPQRTTA
ncbi:MAG: hypothetical protein EON95_06090 [Caulobacteraceae bacterium]|nr:MAG: hypothetical protein EON95_06090 [Caulobacteraceae bacterium]